MTYSRSGCTHFARVGMLKPGLLQPLLLLLRGGVLTLRKDVLCPRLRQRQ